MRDHECGAALHQIREPLLDQRFRLGIQTRSRFVQNQDARIGKDGPRNRNTLALSAGKLHSALSDNRVVFVGKSLGELIDPGNAASAQDVGFARIRARESDILANGAVKKERFLQHNSESGAVGVEGHAAEVDAIDQDFPLGRLMECRDEPDDGGFSRAG